MTQATLGVVCALRSEARQLGRTVTRAAALRTLPDGTLVSITGVGPAAAALGAARLLDAGAGALVSWGMAGALDPALQPGCIFLPSEVCAPDGTCFATDSPWRLRVSAALGACAPQAQAQGRLLTVAAAATSAAEKRALFAGTAAQAVDMESSAVAQAAQAAAVAFLAVRVIVDSAQQELPGAVQAAARTGAQVSVPRLLAHLARHPAELAGLLLLARAYGTANRALAHIARSGALRAGLPGARNAA